MDPLYIIVLHNKLGYFFIMVDTYGYLFIDYLNLIYFIIVLNLILLLCLDHGLRMMV